MKPPPPTLANTFDVDVIPHVVKALFFVVCPRCAGNAIIASTVNDETLIHCSACWWSKIYPVKYGDVRANIKAKL
jgi:hypothetical protein